jgi:arylsulfatase A-like enzyme
LTNLVASASLVAGCAAVAGCGPEARHEASSTLERRVVVADLLEDAIQAADRQQPSRQHRRAGFATRVSVPDNARLSLRGYAKRPKNAKKDTDHAEFIVTADDRVILRKKIELRPSPKQFSTAVDLGEFAGREIDLDFSIAGVRHSSAAHWRRALLETPVALARRPSSDGPNLLLIVVDTLRADHCGLYGHDRPTTPFLDEFAQQATVYERAIAQAPWTLPSVATMLTGTDPTRHGVVAGTEVLAWSEQTIAESIQEAGISTFGVSANPLISSNKNFDQGLEELLILRNARAEEVNRETLIRIDRLDGHRWFGYVHYMDPHTPYDAPAPAGTAFVDPDYDGVFSDPKAVDRLAFTINFGLDPLFPVDEADRAHLGARYDGDILYWDRAFAELVDALSDRGLLEQTIIIITSDHGEELLEHGMVKHGPQLYQESIHVPLVVRSPGSVSGGERVDRPFELRHLPALAVGLMGLDHGGFPLPPTPDSPEASPSFSYAAPALEPRKPWPRHRIASLTGRRWKLIRWFDFDRLELYDLADDPGETVDRAETEPDAVDRMMEVLDLRLHSTPVQVDGDPALEEDLEELRALGYVQ